MGEDNFQEGAMLVSAIAVIMTGFIAPATGVSSRQEGLLERMLG